MFCGIDVVQNTWQLPVVDDAQSSQPSQATRTEQCLLALGSGRGEDADVSVRSQRNTSLSVVSATL